MHNVRSSALVFASDQDAITRYNFPSALEVARVLRLHDTLDVLSLIPFRFPLKSPDGFPPHHAPNGSLHQIALLPTSADDLATKLSRHRVGGTKSAPMTFILGFGSGHGSKGGITRVRQASPFFTEAHASLFRQGILVFAACFKNDTFPRQIVKLPNHRVNAVLGYTGLWGFTPLGIEHNGQRPYHVFKARYLDCLIQPIHSLLQGRSAGESLQDCQQSWSRLAQRCNNPNMKIIAERNATNIRLWGEPTARLPVSP